jgi:ADP-ribose pyrophosphatase YjhB (NUDIX family)
MKPAFEKIVPEGDSRERSVCASCGFVDYENPKIVAGAVVVAADGRILLCRRAIEPRKNFWTLPAGFLENHEQPEDGAIREVREEACADIVLEGLIGLFTVRRLSQVQIFFRARFAGEEAFAAGEETLEAKLVAWDEIPWEELAFPSVTWALKRWREGGVVGLEGLSVAV